MKTMLLIDGNSILNRAFYGIRSLSTKDGKPTNAIYGLIHVISRELQQLRPTYAAIELDPSRATVLQAKTICSILSKNYEYIFFASDAS